MQIPIRLSMTLRMLNMTFNPIFMLLFFHCCRYSLTLVALNGLGSPAEMAIDDFSLSPQCFGLWVPKNIVGNWRYDMTDEEFCKYYGNAMQKLIQQFVTGLPHRIYVHTYKNPLTYFFLSFCSCQVAVAALQRSNRVSKHWCKKKRT